MEVNNRPLHRVIRPFVHRVDALGTRRGPGRRTMLASSADGQRARFARARWSRRSRPGSQKRPRAHDRNAWTRPDSRLLRRRVAPKCGRSPALRTLPSRAIPTRSLLPISVTLEILALKCERRGAGNHAQPLDSRQRCDDLIGDPVAEALLICRGLKSRKGSTDRRWHPALGQDSHGRGPGVLRIDGFQLFEEFARRSIAVLRVLLEGFVDDG